MSSTGNLNIDMNNVFTKHSKRCAIYERSKLKAFR